MSSSDAASSRMVFLKAFLQANEKFQKNYESERDETLRSIRSLLNMLDETSTAEKCEDVRSAIDKAVVRLAINTSSNALNYLTCVGGVDTSLITKSSSPESKSADLSTLVKQERSVFIKTTMGTFTIPYGPTTTLDNVATIIAAGLGWTASEVSFGKDGSPLERRSLGSLGIQPGTVIEARQGPFSSTPQRRPVTPVDRSPRVRPSTPTRREPDNIYRPITTDSFGLFTSPPIIPAMDQTRNDSILDPKDMVHVDIYGFGAPRSRKITQLDAGSDYSIKTALGYPSDAEIAVTRHDPLRITVQIISPQARRPGEMLCDIGIWGTHKTSPLNHVLTGSSASSPSSSTSSTLSSTLAAIPSHLVRDMVTQVKQEKFGSQHHLTHSSHPTVRHQLSSSLVLLSSEQRNALIKEIDRRAESKDTHVYRDDVIPGIEEDIHADFKSTLTFEELSQVVGKEAVDGLLKAFGGDADMVKVRRVKARSVEEGQYCINFHADYAFKTLGIALNDSSEYTGGRIIYAHEDGTLDVPLRTPGTGLLHDNTWVHGVTTLQSGTRYHLFLLKH